MSRRVEPWPQQVDCEGRIQNLMLQAVAPPYLCRPRDLCLNCYDSRLRCNVEARLRRPGRCRLRCRR